MSVSTKRSELNATHTSHSDQQTEAPIKGDAFSSSVEAGPLIFAVASSERCETDSVAHAGASIAEDTRLCISRLATELNAAGASLEDLLKVNCYLAQDRDRVEFWATWADVFETVGVKLSRLTQVAGTGPHCRILMDAIALAPSVAPANTVVSA